MRQQGSKKNQAQAKRNTQAQVKPLVEAARSTSDVKQASSSKCSTCGIVLERIDDCPQCGKGVDKPHEGASNQEKRPFKPYANIGSPIENDLYKILSQAFSEKDPRERPWCGLGLEVGLLAVSPTNLTVADTREVNGVQKAVVHVPQNWREPWHVEAPGGARHQISDNPCDRAERAVSSLKHGLESLRNTDDDQPRRQCIKYLILFPDEYRFEGPKEFFIIEREQVLTLQLKNLRDLPAAILTPTQQQRLDSRNYRSWLEGSILKKTDDSIVGTWLDPAFDKIEPEPAKKPCWRLRPLSRKKAPSEKQDVSATESFRMAPIQRKFNGRQPKLIGIVITGMMVGIIGWRLSDANKSPTSLSPSNSALPPSLAKNSVSAAEADEVTTPQHKISLPEIDNHDTFAVPEVRKSSAPREAELKKHDQEIKSAKKLSERTLVPDDSELKRRKIEHQINQAIRLRAITGVKVYFVGDTAHLKGRVATETQKAAAEKAARSVPGVKDIRSLIEIELMSSGNG